MIIVGVVIIVQLAKSEEFKAQANKLFQDNHIKEAIELYILALDLNPSNHILYANRAFCQIKLENYGWFPHFPLILQIARRTTYLCKTLRGPFTHGISRHEYSNNCDSISEASAGGRAPADACKACTLYSSMSRMRATLSLCSRCNILLLRWEHSHAGCVNDSTSADTQSLW